MQQVQYKVGKSANIQIENNNSVQLSSTSLDYARADPVGALPEWSLHSSFLTCFVVKAGVPGSVGLMGGAGGGR